MDLTFTSEGRLFGGKGIPGLDPIDATVSVDFTAGLSPGGGGFVNVSDIRYSGNSSSSVLGQNIASECNDEW